MATGVTASGIRSLLKGCQDIRELNLSWTDLSEEALDALCSHINPSVETLNISGCRETLSNKHIESIVTSCPLLRELDVSDAINLTAEALELIILHLLRLESLSSSRTYNIAISTYLGLTSACSLR
jgi:F-box and leucine-rich repeat protein 1 (S-phase kinase-associated protein 2)